MTIRNGVKVLVINEIGQVLLMQRTDTDDRRPGEWDIPGGGVDDGEDFAEAGARELLEETGIIALPADLKAIYANTMLYESGDVSANRLLYVLHVARPQVSLSPEHNAMRWVSLDEALAEFPHPIYNAGIVYARQNDLI